MARRGHLPGLRPQLRRRRRRRHRRPRRASAPACPTSAELGVDAIWLTPFYPSPQADAGYDVADYRDVDPLFGTLADVDGLIADAHAARPAGDRRHRPQPHVERAPVVPGGAGRAAREPRSGPATSSATARPGRRRAAQRLAQHVRRPGVDPRRRGRRPARAVVPPPVRTGAARPRLDERRGAGRVRVDPALLARPRRRRVPHRRRPRPGQGPGAARPRGTVRDGGPAPSGHPHWDQDEVHDVYRGVAAGDRRVRRRAGLRRRGLGAPRPSGSPATCAPTSCTRRSTSTSCWRRGTPRRCARRSTTASTPSPPSARRRPGCCPTTTSSATSPATAAASSDAAGPGRRRCSCSPCPAAPTSTRARSSACPRSSDLPDDARQDPTFLRTEGERKGRDGCRVPDPVVGGDAPPFGFGPGDVDLAAATAGVARS